MPPYISTDNELTKEEILNKIKVLDIAHGGTGKATRKEAFDNLAFLGYNPVSSPDEDTTQKWCELGNGYAFFDTDGLMVNQPYTFMFVINYHNATNDVFQIVCEQKSGSVYYRNGNSKDWYTNWTPLLGANSIIPVENGGTGKATKKEAFRNLSFLGAEPIASNAEDTVQKWNNLGAGYAWFGQPNRMINQPYTYMFVLNYVQDSDVFQIGSTQSDSNTVYFRSGNASGWHKNWTPLLSTNNTSLLATTIQNLIDKGEIHMEKQYIISDSGMTTETFANNVSCIGLQDDSVKVLGKFIPQHDGTILVQTKATNSSDARDLSLYYTAMHTGSRYGGFDRYRAKNSGTVNTAISQKATMFFDNVKIPAGTILTGKYSFLIYESVELNSWAKKQTSYSYMVLTVQKNRPVTFYCDSNNSFSDSGLTNITLQIMYKVV